MGSELAVREPQDSGAIQAFQPEQLELLKRTICRGATDDEFKLFVHVAQKTGLDPFARQIHAVKRWDAQAGRECMSIQTGIDGYRLIADRTGRYMPGREPSYEYADGQIVKATAYVQRIGKDGQYHEVAASAFYSEYAQTKKDGSPTRMWAQMPHVMLAKCAEAQALRKAFPAEMSGVYTHEEMQQADVVEVEARPVAPSPADVPAAAPAPADPRPRELQTPEQPDREQYQRAWVAFATTRKLDLAASKVFLRAAFAKRGTTVLEASRKDWDDAIAALSEGKFDSSIAKLAAKSAPAAAAPAPAPSEPTAPAADPDTQLPVLEVATVAEFEESAAGMAPESLSNEAYRTGLNAWYGSLRKPQNVEKPEPISPMKLNECLSAMAVGRFDWSSGKILARKSAA